VLPALTFLPVELVAVCDIDRERGTSTAQQYGAACFYENVDELYSMGGVDAVMLCVSGRLHPTLAISAFDAGLHVWSEKPPAMEVSETEEMLRHRKDRVYVVDFKKAFMPSTRKVLEIFDTNGCGPVRSILGVYPISIGRGGTLGSDSSTRWPSDGWHPLSVMLEVGGDVDGVTVIRNPRNGGACVLEFASGAVGNLHLAEGTPISQPMELYQFYGQDCRVDLENGGLRVRFERGIPFEYESATSYLGPGFDNGSVVWEAQNTLNTLENNPLFTQGIYFSLMHFCQSVLEGRAASIGTLERARDITAVMEAALRSEGERVDVAKSRG
jgi:predicted dehydrogenase